ncbi:MAG: ABC transporter ATP-binding protein [Nanoarchaeota archaeon]|nr:ABC transporter ATP-binding protein [Nanoarchaeota archaeon]MBU1029951.1 ABC transporter ATP-binding protein [Nanoarchaeota archaeon]MBU1849616.1 ABC transporter ATP-binding protein [Nanoarchaeota archaeon]
MKLIIKVLELCKSYGKTLALDKFSLDIPAGCIYGLLGPNGAGKTTLIGVLSGLIKKYSGQVRVSDKTDFSEIKKLIGLMPQDSSFYNNMSSFEHLKFFARLQGLTKSNAVIEAYRVMKLTGLDGVAKKNVGSLSHGMRKRLGIAQAILGRPKIVILDEPTNGLDPKIAKTIRDLIKQLKAENTTILFSSHNLYEVEELADFVAIMHKGRLLKKGSVLELKKSKSAEITIVGLKKELLNSIRIKPYIETVSLVDNTLLVSFKKKDETNKLLELLINHDVVISKIKKGDSLEDIYVNIVGEEI